MRLQLESRSNHKLLDFDDDLYGEFGESCTVISYLNAKILRCCVTEGRLNKACLYKLRVSS